MLEQMQNHEQRRPNMSSKANDVRMMCKAQGEATNNQEEPARHNILPRDEHMVMMAMMIIGVHSIQLAKYKLIN